MNERIKISKVLIYLLGVIILFYTLFPFFWAVVSSLKTGSNLFSSRLIPADPSLENYTNVFSQQPFGQNIFNSILVAAATVSVSLFLGILASYALSRNRFRGRKMILYAFLSISIFPQVAILSGLFEVIRALGLYNQWIGLVFSYMIFSLPFTIWTLSAFMKVIPKEIEEAAMVDGASSWVILFKVLFPMMSPALATTALLVFVAAWNEFLFALTFTISERARTVPVAIALMSGASEHELPWGNIMAASIIVTLPIVLLVFIFRKYVISGLTAGALKG